MNLVWRPTVRNGSLTDPVHLCTRCPAISSLICWQSSVRTTPCGSCCRHAQDCSPGRLQRPASAAIQPNLCSLLLPRHCLAKNTVSTFLKKLGQDGTKRRAFTNAVLIRLSNRITSPLTERSSRTRAASTACRSSHAKRGSKAVETFRFCTRMTLKQWSRCALTYTPEISLTPEPIVLS